MPNKSKYNRASLANRSIGQRDEDDYLHEIQAISRGSTTPNKPKDNPTSQANRSIEKMTAENENEFFIRIKDGIDQTRDIPHWYVKAFRDIIPRPATMLVINGPWKDLCPHVVDISAGAGGRDLSFGNGWSGFLNQFPVGSVLVFGLQGDSAFKVEVLVSMDTNTIQTQNDVCSLRRETAKIPPPPPAPLKHHRPPSPPTIFSPSPPHTYPSPPTPPHQSSLLPPLPPFGDAESARNAAKLFVDKGGHQGGVRCTVTLGTSYTSKLRIPAELSKAMNKPGTVKLIMPYGRDTIINCRPKTEGSSVILGKGWSGFVKDNSLKEGDTCVIELVDQNPPDSQLVELLVRLFRI